MRERLARDIQSIEQRVREMGALSAAMLRDGVTALEKLDKDLAHSVVGRNEALAQFDEDIEHHILTTMTLQSPVAGDLRRTGAALKLITYLNRLGRYGYDIARVALDWPADRGHVAKMVNVRDMATKVETMLDLALTAFEQRTIVDEDALMALENDVDALRHSVFRECLTYMAEEPANIEPCAHYMMVARYLERCGDNICKMAEKLHYAKTGHRLLLP